MRHRTLSTMTRMDQWAPTSAQRNRMTLPSSRTTERPRPKASSSWSDATHPRSVPASTHKPTSVFARAQQPRKNRATEALRTDPTNRVEPLISTRRLDAATCARTAHRIEATRLDCAAAGVRSRRSPLPIPERGVTLAAATLWARVMKPLDCARTTNCARHRVESRVASVPAMSGMPRVRTAPICS